jgi:hypothetical protein
MCSGRGNEPLRSLGFPIRKSPDQCLVTDSPGLIAGSYVLHRLLVPRHPPCALINLATTDDARVHCAVLKIRAVPDPGRLAAGDPVLVEVRPTGGRSLRTQQRARPGRLPGRLSVPLCEQLLAQPPSGRTNRPGQQPEPNNQCSTNERPSRLIRPRNGPGRTSPIVSASAPVAP